MKTANRKVLTFWSFLFVLFFAVDRAIKSFFLGNREYSRDIWRVGRSFFVRFRLEENSGIAFSIDFYFPLLIALTIFALVFLLVLFSKAMSEERLLGMLGAALIFLGALSNLYDRLVYGYVLDYIDFSYFSVFNIADTMITAGLIVSLLQEFLRGKKRG